MPYGHARRKRVNRTKPFVYWREGYKRCINHLAYQRQSSVLLEVHSRRSKMFELFYRHRRVYLNFTAFGANSSAFGSMQRTTISQDVRTRFSVQLAFAKFLSKIKGIFNTVSVSWIQHSLRNFLLFIKGPTAQALYKANCTGNQVCTSCDIVVLGHCKKKESFSYNSKSCTGLAMNFFHLIFFYTFGRSERGYGLRMCS